MWGGSPYQTFSNGKRTDKFYIILTGIIRNSELTYIKCSDFASFSLGIML